MGRAISIVVHAIANAMAARTKTFQLVGAGAFPRWPRKLQSAASQRAKAPSESITVTAMKTRSPMVRLALR